MKEMMRRLISFMLAVTLVLGLVPAFAPHAHATEVTEPTAEATEPATEATEPSAEVTEPTTEPSSTETEPEATEPEATEPEVTEPEETEPEATEPEAVVSSLDEVWSLEDFRGKKVSILGDSISTYENVSNGTSYNSTIGNNAVYYYEGRVSSVRLRDTWWQQMIDMLDMKLVVNNSSSGSAVLTKRGGVDAAYIDRCRQLHNDSTGEEPEVIFVYLGTNDFSISDDVWGTEAEINYDELIVQGSDGTYTYATPKTVTEGYAIMLHKIHVRYPGAKVFGMGMLMRSTYDSRLTEFNLELEAVMRHFGVPYIKLEDLTDTPAGHKACMANNLHPKAEGMDQITQRVLNTLTGNEIILHDINYALTGVKASNSIRMSLDRGSYTTTLTLDGGYEDMSVTVTMGGRDITESCYSDGTISIDRITGEVNITATAELVEQAMNYRWELNGDRNALVTSATGGNTANTLTLAGSGTITDGLFSGVTYTMDKTVKLRASNPWMVEWKSSGDGNWMLLSGDISNAEGSHYLYHQKSRSLWAIGHVTLSEESKKVYNNYGLTSGNAFDMTQVHTFRLENRVDNEAGTNMVYLVVDDMEIGALDSFYNGINLDSAADGTWVNGKNLAFNSIGTNSFPLTSINLEYLQVWENGPAEHKHTYAYSNTTEGTCREEGYDTYTCSCEATFDVPTGQLGSRHNYGEWTYVDGFLRRDCADCGNVEFKDLVAYRWELNSSKNALVSVTTGGNTANPLTLYSGTITDGVFSKIAYTMETPVTLSPDKDWVIEWRSSGNNTNAMILTSDVTNAQGAEYLFHQKAGIWALGHRTSTYNNYGLKQSYGEEVHTFRLENRIADNGTNTIYMIVDDEEIGAFDTYYQALNVATSPDTVWTTGLTGRELTFNAIGAKSFQLSGFNLEYLQIWTNGAPHVHWYEVTESVDSTCTTDGYKVYTCQCGDTYTEPNGALLPHDLGAWVVSEGKLRRDCRNCDHYELKELLAYRWELNEEKNALVSVSDNGNTENALTLQGTGTITDGVFYNIAYTMEKAVTLNPQERWVIEWKSSGDCNVMLLNGSVTNGNGAQYLYHQKSKGEWAFGYKEGSAYNNYGLMTKSIDMTDSHVFRLVNRVKEDGTNMVYFVVDGTEIGALNNFYKGVTADPSVSGTWLNGQTLTFNAIGNTTFQLTGFNLEYLQIWVNGEPHEHAFSQTGINNGTCVSEGYYIHSCACGDVYHVSTGKLGDHVYGEWVINGNEMRRECTLCDAYEVRELAGFRWEINSEKNELVSVSSDKLVNNALTKVSGSITDGVFSKIVYTMEYPVTLSPNREWIIEWVSSNDWQGMLLSADNANPNGNEFLFRQKSNNLLVLGENVEGSYHNYGVWLSSYKISLDGRHTFRLENRVDEENGTNMVYLLVDDVEIATMDNYFVGTSNQKTQVDWLNGRELTFRSFGVNGSFSLSDIALEYLQIWVNGSDEHMHAYHLISSTDGNCMATGENTYECACGHVKTASNGKYGSHVFKEWTVVDDMKQSTCEVCNLTETVSIGAYYDESVSNNYYSVLSQKNYVLCDGVTESEIILNNAAGSRRQIMNVVEVDTSNTNVEILAGYYGIDKDLTDSKNWSARTMDVMMDYYRDELGYNVVAGMNTALTYVSDAPCSFLVYNGQVLATPGSIYNDGCNTYMAVIKNDDGTVRCEMRLASEPLKGNEWQAVAANFDFCVENGEMNYTEVDRSGFSDRSVLGVKADGTLVILQVEGENASLSTGLNRYELSETMLALGCEWAIICDGGGSSQIFTKREGESDYVLRNLPSDGTPRATINGIIIASKAKEDGEFDHLSMVTEDTHITPNGTATVVVKGVDGAGAPADMPEGVTYEATGGTYADGVFTSDGTLGEHKVTAFYQGREVGSVEINVVVPTSITFENTAMAVPFGKRVEIRIIASYGTIGVKVDAHDFKFELTENLGTIEGMTFVAPEASDTVTDISGELKATLIHNEELSATVPVYVGKGSEVLYDFEDQSVHKWYRSTHTNYNTIKPGGSTYIVDANSGKVHSGDYAMAVEIDYSNSLEPGFQLATLINGELDILEDALTLGMWIYFPDEAEALRINVNAYAYASANGIHTNSIYGAAGVTGVGETTIAEVGFVKGMDESGWRYVTIDMSNYQFTGTNVVLQFYISQKSGKNGYNYGYASGVNGKYVLYVDDVTVDYSRAVDDRDPPEFSGMTYAIGSGEHKPLNGETVSSGRLSFTASVEDFVGNMNRTGIDTESGRVFIDGLEYTDSLTWSENGKVMRLNDVNLSGGMHTVKFGVCDKAGNYNSIVRTITVGSADSAKVRVVPHDPNADRLLLGSLYYIDLIADDPETISSVTTTLDLNNISVWQLDHMQVADGFKATYNLIKDENIATVTVSSTGGTSLRGEDQILVSIPIRTWELAPTVPFDNRTEIWMYDSYKAWDEILPMDLHVEVDEGSVRYKNGATATFTSPRIKVDTEMCGNGYTSSGDAMYNYIGDEPWYADWNGGHDHRPDTAQYYKEGSTNHVDAIKLRDKSPTCTEAGYAGRTYCEVCKSIVEWGVTTPAMGHVFSTIDGVLKCEYCDVLFNGIHTDGKEYTDGVVISDGWVGESYYRNGSMVKGVQMVPSPEDATVEYYYDFGEYGVCKNQSKFTGLFRDGDVYRYAYIGVLSSGWHSIDENWYYFSPETMANVSGRYKIDGIAFVFENNGKLTEGVWVDTLEGRRYYYGPSCHMWHWLEVDGKLYYFKEGYMLTGRQNVRTLETPNVRSWYDFGDDGVCRGILDGIVEANGNYYYTENGVGLEKYLVYYDGNYYFAEYDGKLVTNQRKYAYVTNCDLPCEWYYFGPDGKMVGGKDGGSIVEIDGELRYYEKGRPAEKGLVCVDGDYYFTMYNGELVINKNYYAWMTSCDLPKDRYDFGPDGKMIGSKAEGEIVEVNGEKLYYEKGKPAEKGLVCVDGDYYFSVYGGKLITDQVYYAWMTSCDLPKERYEFGPDGKMLQGIVEKDGILYYYENGKGTEKGLVEYEGDYYFTMYKGEVVTDQEYYAWMTSCDLPMDRYEFGPDGKMLQGVVEKDGILYYYENGKGAEKGLIEYEGNYYFAMYKGELVVSQNYYAWMTNCDLPMGRYEFGSDGKMYRGIVELDGVLYYYENGKAFDGGLVRIEGDYYFAGGNGKLAVNETVMVTETDYDMPLGAYTFGPDGKAMNGFVTKDGSLYFYDKGRTLHGLFFYEGAYYCAENGGKLVTDQICYVQSTRCDLPTGTYEFGADGKMVQGIVERDGAYYYENGRRVEKRLFYLDGYYYFAHTGGKLVTGQKFYVYEANGLLIEKEYEFNELGQMVG